MKEKKLKNEQPAIFRLHFSPLILVALIAVLVLCAACFAVATWQVVILIQDASEPAAMDWIKYGIMYFVAVFMAVLDISILAKSQYIIGNGQLVSQFGIVRSPYDIDKICSLRLFEKSNKLTVYFDDFKTKYMVILVSEIWYEDFVKELQKRNDKIEFELVCPPDKPEKDDKKNDKKKK